MKKIFTLGLILVALTTVAQSKYKKADKLFDNMYYLEASRIYEQAFDDEDLTQDFIQRAGDSYYFNSEMESAVTWYDKLFLKHKNEEIESIYAFRYIHSLQGANDLKKAEMLIGYFSELKLLDEIQVEQLVKVNQNAADEILVRRPEFEIYRQPINSPYSDFGPMFYKDKIVFSSARDTTDLHSRQYHWNEQSFLNLYMADKKSGENAKTADSLPNSKKQRYLQLIDPVQFSGEINTRFHEASVSFTPNQKTVYFTRNNYTKRLKRDTAGVNHLKLYKANYSDSTGSRKRTYQDGAWIDITELPFNSDDYSVGHPALSSDGKTLYFVSDMPGGAGATDLYKVTVNGDGTYGSPVNLGPEVNTSGREMFPYVSDTKLYFSSDGLIGLGSLDVFETQLNEDGTYYEPRNLGVPINSDLDDFAFIIDESDGEGYFSSNRKGGKGDDDIYSFIRMFDVPLEPCTQTAGGTVVNRINQEVISFATVQLFDSASGILETVEADKDGKFMFATILDCERTYRALASKEGFKEEVEKEEFFTTAELGLELGLALAIEPEISLITEVNGVKKFQIENLYFDLDKSFIRPDAAIQLEKIVAVMTEYPSIIIKIESHTDSRGSDLYNENLSDRRAKSTRDYIISKGIAAERIQSAIGYGENRLLNECRNRTKCSNEKHDINRRSEFIITKM